jgi:hypothetical protein
MRPQLDFPYEQKNRRTSWLIERIISLGNRRFGCIFGNKSQRQSIAQVCGLSLCTTDHTMTIITATPNALESFASPTDWMASFLDFQISKLEEHSEDVPVGMDTKLPKTIQKPIWS